MTEAGGPASLVNEPWSIGRCVVAKGLTGAKHLNGLSGKVLHYDSEKGRYAIDFGNGEGGKLLKPENLEECQKSDWRSHRKESAVAKGADAKPEASVHGTSKAALLGAMSEIEVPCWGGPVLAEEALPLRLNRVLTEVASQGSKAVRRRYGDRFAKARELFRLGLLLYLEQDWESCVLALVEGLLLEEKAVPQSLAEVKVSEGPASCPFGRLVETLRGQQMSSVPRWALQLAMLEAQWLDMQMLFARELCSRHQETTEVASEHQRRWFELLCSMDDLARKTIEVHGNDPSSDRRVLSRLTLVQAQYGSNPPLSRPAADCARLAERAVALWPEDPVALLWSSRPQDLIRLDELLEIDAPQREKLKRFGLNAGNAGYAVNTGPPKIEEIFDDGDDGFKITGGDFVVLDGDHTDQDYSEVAAGT